MAKTDRASDERTETIEAIRDELVALKRSPLYAYRVENGYRPVIGEGRSDARVLFVGEAPGENEAKTGRPFCGRAGKVLDELLGSIGADRSQVYITNLVNDRPPENRDPKDVEIALYGPFLERLIDVIRPEIMVTLGRHSMKYIFERFGLAKELRPISKIHGKEFVGKAPYGDVTVVALYHPAFALYNGSTKAHMKEDVKILKKYI